MFLFLDSTKSEVAQEVLSVKTQKKSHWFLLYRKSNVEILYFGVPGDIEQSEFVKQFTVKTGVPGKKPTPLPKLSGREYWVIIAEADSSLNPETSPYFLTLDVPTSDQVPFGPANYPECPGGCNWELPGYFGLHGTGADPSKISPENEGSSGCIRHSDEDIIYLYNLLDPTTEEIRYYIEDK